MSEICLQPKFDFGIDDELQAAILRVEQMQGRLSDAIRMSAGEDIIDWERWRLSLAKEDLLRVQNAEHQREWKNVAFAKIDPFAPWS